MVPNEITFYLNDGVENECEVLQTKNLFGYIYNLSGRLYVARHQHTRLVYVLADKST